MLHKVSLSSNSLFEKWPGDVGVDDEGYEIDRRWRPPRFMSAPTPRVGRWLKKVPLAEAVREKGFFGNQNSAAKPRAKSWPHTVERLKQRFGIVD